VSFANLLTHAISVQRPTATTGVKKTYQTVATGIACLIQPLDDLAGAQTGSAYGKGFRCYAAIDANVLEGDQVTDQDGHKYGVRGLRKRPYGNYPYLDVLLGEDKRP